ncbi:RNA-directed DNA polymerase, eukaryota, reverse transcriptase zinc-binding domain protein [Tanacetum coccineum]
MLGWNTDAVNLNDLELDKRIVGKDAWVMLGDMNVTLAPNEHSYGSSFMTGDMNEFRDCINFEMEDVAKSWGNETFIAKFGKAHAIFLPYLISDHCPTVLIFHKAIQAKKRAFKFFNFVADKEEFLPFGEVDVGRKYGWMPNVQNYEEKILYQKAKVKWLSVGDRNNAYFHKVLKSSNHKCRINTIHDGYGNKYERDGVSEQFMRHFQNFLGEEVQVKHMKNINMLIKNKLYEAEANEMLRDVSDVEIKEAMFLIDGNKAPGLDGLSSLFYKRACNIVREDVCKAVSEFS